MQALFEIKFFCVFVRQVDLRLMVQKSYRLKSYRNRFIVIDQMTKEKSRQRYFINPRTSKIMSIVKWDGIGVSLTAQKFRYFTINSFLKRDRTAYFSAADVAIYHICTLNYIQH